jgi:hypothetical protein
MILVAPVSQQALLRPFIVANAQMSRNCLRKNKAQPHRRRKILMQNSVILMWRYEHVTVGAIPSHHCRPVVVKRRLEILEL